MHLTLAYFFSFLSLVKDHEDLSSQFFMFLPPFFIIFYFQLSPHYFDFQAFLSFLHLQFIFHQRSILTFLGLPLELFFIFIRQDWTIFLFQTFFQHLGSLVIVWI